MHSLHSALSLRFLFAVASGSAIGGVARYVAGIMVHRVTGAAFPWGTLVVNLAGCFLMGVFAAWSLGRASWSDEARLFVLTGLLGGFTTFSTFAFETVRLLEHGAWWRAGLNVGSSVLVGLGALWMGVVLVRGFR